jgi:hypothetical protein
MRRWDVSAAFSRLWRWLALIGVAGVLVLGLLSSAAIAMGAPKWSAKKCGSALVAWEKTHPHANLKAQNGEIKALNKKHGCELRKNPGNHKNPTHTPTCANGSGGACSYSGTTSQGFKVQFVVAAGRGRSPGVAVDSFTVILQETCTDGQTLMGGTGFLTTPGRIDTQGHFSYTSSDHSLHVSGQLQEPTGQPGSGASGTVEETTQNATGSGTCHASVTFTATSHR